MSDGGNFNRAGRRGGGDPMFNRAGTLAGLAPEHINMLTAALDIDGMAKKNEIPVADVIAKARETGYIDCSDEDAKWLEDFLTKDEFNPSQP